MEQEDEQYKDHRLEPEEIPLKVFSHKEYLESVMDDAQYRAWADQKIYELRMEVSDLKAKLAKLQNK